MQHVDELLSSVREFTGQELPFFSDCVRKAFGSLDPVFIRERYGAFFFHCAGQVPGWIASVVLANADAESHGSEKLFWLWRGAAANAAISKNVLIHAKDESRHSRIFISLVGDAFPELFPTAALQLRKADLFRIAPELLKQERFELPEEHLMDHLVQMNMGEIRTRAHMILLSPVIYAFAPAESKERVSKVLEGLVTDEIRHISYTAEFIESWCENGAKRRIHALYRRRLTEFHRLTIEQTERAVRAYGASEYPDLLEI